MGLLNLFILVTCVSLFSEFVRLFLLLVHLFKLTKLYLNELLHIYVNIYVHKYTYTHI